MYIVGSRGVVIALPHLNKKPKLGHPVWVLQLTHELKSEIHMTHFDQCLQCLI